MHNLTAARPYARAIFDGVESSVSWLAALRVLSLAVQEPVVMEILHNPQISDEKWREFFSSILQQSFNNAGLSIEKKLRNLLALLIENKRLSLLPDIERVYQILLAESEGIEELEVSSAFPLSEKELEQLRSSLEKRLKSRVNLSLKIDPSLIGGVLIRNENKSWALDYSIKDQLNRLRSSLMV